MSTPFSLAALFMLAALAGGQEAPGQRPIDLTVVTRLTCAFPLSAAMSWENGEPRAQVRDAAVLKFAFDQIDVQDGSARFVPAATEPEHVIVQRSGANLYFLNVQPRGTLSITTVFAQESRAGKLKAVHSRTDYLPVSVPGFVALPEASQHYGECALE